MSYDFFSDRELGKKQQKLEKINAEVYNGIIGIYKGFKLFLGGNFTECCPDDDNVICGFDEGLFLIKLRALVPNFADDYGIKYKNCVYEADQYNLFDFIEFIYKNIQNYKILDFHGFYGHNHLRYFDSEEKKQEFQEEINQIFQRNGLAYKLNDKGQIERILPKGLENEIGMYKELIPNKDKELFELIDLGLEKIKNPKLEENQIALEKLWDAFERIKTYYGEKNGFGDDKKDSSNKLFEQISEENKTFKKFIDKEYKYLTKSGNEFFQIRHFEKNNVNLRTRLISKKHIDYLFYRMLSLLTLSLMYTK